MSTYNHVIIKKSAGAGVTPSPVSFSAQPEIKEPDWTLMAYPKKNLGAFLDKVFRNTTLFFAFLVFSIMFGILITLFVASLPALKQFGPGFFTSDAWNPVTVQFGGLVPIYGTIVTSLIAMLIGIPVSFGIALFITELSPNWLKRPIGIAIELLAGIPSIIYGMWGLFVFAPFAADHIQPWINDNMGNLPLVGAIFQGPPMGIGMLTAGFILAIMVIPFTSSVMRDVFEIVPPMLKESAYGLGATTWEVVRNVVLPYTKVGVVGGIMLTLGLTLFVITFIVLALAKLLLIKLSAREGKQS
jgi:phosphate transport system permease protein